MAGLRWFDLARAAMPLFAGAIPLISFRQVEQALNFERAMGPKWSRPSHKCCRGWEHGQAHRLCFLRCQDVEAKKIIVFEGITGHLTSPSEALLDLLAFVSWGHHVGPNPSWPWLPGSAPSDWPKMEAAASHPEGQLQKARFVLKKCVFVSNLRFLEILGNLGGPLASQTVNIFWPRGYSVAVLPARITIIKRSVSWLHELCTRRFGLQHAKVQLSQKYQIHSPFDYL